MAEDCNCGQCWYECPFCTSPLPSTHETRIVSVDEAEHKITVERVHRGVIEKRVEQDLGDPHRFMTYRET